MGQALSLRPAAQEDFPAVFRLLKALWPTKPLEEAAQHGVYEAMLQDPSAYILLVAENETGVVAFGSAHVTLNAYYDGPMGYVMALVVSPDIRGGGIGGQVLAALEQAARAEGCGAMELDSATHREAAHAFYVKRGYAIQGLNFNKHL